MEREVRLRSSQWYDGDDRNAYIHRAWMRCGVPHDAFSGRPQIEIANTASALTPCNAHLMEVATSVKAGVYEAGGIPLELPVVALGETQVAGFARPRRGWERLYLDTVQQAHLGADLDFLVGSSGSTVSRESH